MKQISEYSHNVLILTNKLSKHEVSSMRQDDDYLNKMCEVVKKYIFINCQSVMCINYAVMFKYFLTNDA